MEYKLKVFLNGEEEVRIFSYAFQEGFSNFEHRINSIFNINDTLETKIFWRDFEGDHIRLSSDDDLRNMLTELQTTPQSHSKFLKFYIQTKPIGGESRRFNSSEHPSVTCDGCNSQPIRGNRYKCLECLNYDLCDKCFERNIHPQHMMAVMRSSEHPYLAQMPIFDTIQELLNRTLGRKRFMERIWKPEEEKPKQEQSSSGEAQTEQTQHKGESSPLNPTVSSAPVGETFSSTQQQQQPANPGVSSETAPSQQTSDTFSGYLPGSGWEGAARHFGVFPNLFRGLYPMQPSVPSFSPTPNTPPTSPPSSATKDQGPIDQATLSPHIQKALGHMLNMGYVDENGWLTRMLIRHNGDICKCLDDIQQQHASSFPPQS